MSSPKCLVCTCEDVTRVELEEALDAGLQDLESLKRYTGLGTGPCQGKSCLTLTRAVIAAKLGDAVARQAGTITFRAPTTPIPLGHLAGDDEPEAV